jgi:hypothetical protein
MFRELGAYEEARPRYEGALEGFRELKDNWMTAWTLEGLGRTSFLEGDYRKATDLLKESMALFDSLGDRGGAVFMLRRLGMLVRAEGNHVRAACLLGAFKTLHEGIIGQEGMSRLDYPKELSNAFEEYQSEKKSDWIHGTAMSFERAIEYALGESDEVR